MFKEKENTIINLFIDFLKVIESLKKKLNTMHSENVNFF